MKKICKVMKAGNQAGSPVSRAKSIDRSNATIGREALNVEDNVLKGSTKISISVSELRELLSERDAAARHELIEALTQVEKTSDTPRPEQFARARSATRMIVERLCRKAESLTRQRQKRRDRQSMIQKAKSMMSNARPAVQADNAPSLFSQSDIVKIKQIMRRRDGIKKNLLALIANVALRTKSSALALVARSIEVALDFVGQIHADIHVVSSTGRVRSAAFSIPTIQHLIAPLAPASVRSGD